MTAAARGWAAPAQGFDAVVVGSGFGGAVSAARLAARGLRVLVLERGPWWGENAVRDEARSRPLPRGMGLRRLVRGVRWARGRRGRDVQLRADGLWEWHAHERAHALVASGVGGGSLVHTNLVAEPHPDVFDAFPPELSGDELAESFARVRALLAPAPAPQPSAREHAFAAATARAGLPAPRAPELAVRFGADPTRPETVENAAGQQQATCRHVAECVLGCPYQAKTSLDRTHVPIALGHGAQLRALCEVTAIGADERGYWVAYTDHHTGEAGRVTTPRLVLAAGTLGTVRLLLDARDRLRTLPRLPGALGSRFTTNGDVLGFAADTATLADATDGPTVTATTEAVVDGRRMTLAEAGLPVSAMPLPRRGRRRLETTIAVLAMGDEQASARLRLDGGTVRSDASRAQDPGYYEAVERAVARLAKGYRPARTAVAWPTGAGRDPLLTVHPLGGAPVGRDPSEGVCDHRGAVFGHPGLYVADGALLPRAPACPPSLLIAALAERQAGLVE